MSKKAPSAETLAKKPVPTKKTNTRAQAGVKDALTPVPSAEAGARAEQREEVATRTRKKTVPAVVAPADQLSANEPAVQPRPVSKAKATLKAADKPSVAADAVSAKPVAKRAQAKAEKEAAVPEAKGGKARTGIQSAQKTVLKSAETKAAKSKATPARQPTDEPSLSFSTDGPVVAAAPKAGAKFDKAIASRPASSLKSPVRIFQIYFETWQKELLDPAFAPINNAGTRAETLEFDVFERLAKSEYVKGATLWGALSWRFSEKTGMSGGDLVKAIEAKPGMDVYFCNPYPVNEALFHNMWTHGETRHPRFLALAKAVFQAAGLPEEELSGVATANAFSAANYFIATPAFWAKYLPFVRRVLTLAEKKLSPEARALLHSAKADENSLHKGATYVPFIVERLFPVFLKTEGRDLKAYKIALPERERELNVHLKLLREMKDVAHRTKSPWLAACWVNYRNLYLSQTNGREWCQKYLRAVTPTEIKFL